MASFTPDKNSKPAFSAQELKNLKAKSERARLAAARSDPDASPLGIPQLQSISLGQRIRALRARMNASQAEFAKRYHVPIGTLRDLEQGRTEGDAITKSFIFLIEKDPKGVARKLADVA